jgi:predicted TPR repeat methyltransferase
MLDEAAKRALYTELAKAEAVEFLTGRPARFDLVFAADMLVYLGDLQPLFDAVARSTMPGGLFVMSVETTEEADYQLLPSGRFAHAAGYLERLARPRFTVLVRQEATIRLEAGRPAEGMFLALERRS